MRLTRPLTLARIERPAAINDRHFINCGARSIKNAAAPAGEPLRRHVVW